MVKLPAVAQTGGDAVDGQVDAGDHAAVGIARAVALEQLDLNVIQRINVRKAVADRIRAADYVRATSSAAK